MFGIGHLLVLSLVSFIFFALLLSYEKRNNKRYLSSFRERLDTVIIKVTNYIDMKVTYLSRHIIKLSWYYSVHKLLRFILSLLVKAYDYLETIFSSNHARAKELKKEKKKLVNNHLGQMAEHKEAVSLSPQQKKKLLQNKLERG